MKKTALKIITCIFLTALSLFVFTACNKGVGSHDHVFSTYVSDNNATFDNDGTKTAVCDVDGCNETDTVIDVGSKLTYTSETAFIFEGGTVKGLTDYGKTLDKIHIPQTINGETVTSIGEYAFKDCGTLISIQIPNSVTNIGNAAFLGCKWLTNIEMPNNVTSIGDRAFYLCYSLTSIEIPNSVKSIGKEAFAFCSSLTSVNYTGTIDEWAQIEFSGSTSNPLCYNKDLYINGELVTDANLTTATKISDYAFYGCSSITSVKISNSVTSIGNYAFDGCISLANVIIGDSVTSIGDYAFYGCVSLANVTIGDRVTSIGDYAFCSYRLLTSIEIPRNVTSIGYNAFSGCYNLIEVINKSSLNIQKNSYGLNALIVHKGESKIVNVNDYLFITVDGVNYLVNYVGNKTELKLPENYNGQDYVINNHVFFNNDLLISIEIPNGATSIGKGAFAYCDLLTSVIIGNDVKEIFDAFHDCKKLTSITYNGTVEEWEKIKKYSDWNYNVSATKVICSDGEVEI